MSVQITFLGTAQDGGIPQVGCGCKTCTEIREGKRAKSLQVALGVENTETKNKYIFEATPAFAEQYHKFIAEDNATLDGIFLTHAHIGHYTGLMYLGRETLNSKAIKVYVSKKMASFLSSNAPWSQLINLKNIELVEFESGKEISLAGGITVIPIEVPHRNEFADTHSFIIKGEKSFFFVPDIDSWEGFEDKLKDLHTSCDYLVVDATFYTKKELGDLRGRSYSEVPHPTVEETIDFIENNNLKSDNAKIILTHFNHTNLLFKDEEKIAKVKEMGMIISEDDMCIKI